MSLKSTRNRRRLALFCAVATLLGTFASARSARADDVADEADHLFSLGAEAYQSKDYKTALQDFLASNRLVRNRNVMFNIARTYEHLGRPSDAYRYFQRALDGETDPGTKQRVHESLSRLGPSVALLKVETDPPGATLYLGRKDLGDRGTAPQSIALTPGSYTVIAELAGYEDAVSKPVDVRTGSEKPVALKLTRIVGTLRVVGAGGSSVRLDTEDSPQLCVAPCEVQVPPGQHTLILSKQGFRTARQSVVVRANAMNEARPDIEAETGTVVVNADERDAVIEIDGNTKGFTPAVVTVPVGPHELRVQLRGFRPVVRAIEVKANAQTQVDLQLVSADAVEAASRVAEPIDDAPASVTLLTSPELRAMHYPTVADAVQGVRGVYVSDDTAYKTVGFRGFSRPGDYGNRALILVDGMPTNDDWLWSSYSGYDLRSDLDDVERIEVVRGPGSVLYGTGAFSGAINLITNTRDTPEGREVGVSTANDGVAHARARITHHFSPDAGVTTSISGAKGGGRDFFFPEYATTGPASVQGNTRGLDGFYSGTLTGRVWWKWLSAQWSFNTHDKTLPSGQFDVLFGDARARQTDTRTFLEVKADPKVTSSLTSITRAYVNGYFYRGHFPRSPEDGGVERSSYDGSWAGGEQRFIWEPTSKLRLTAGGEAQYHYLVHQTGSDETRGTFLDNASPFSLFAGYALADILPTKAIKISAGARVDSYSFTKASINPRLAFILKPYEGGNVKIMVGKAFRAPSAYELYNIAGGGQKQNTALTPEDLYSAEVEYTHRFSTTVVATGAVYANWIKDLIAQRDLPDATAAAPSYAYQNTAVPVGTLGGEFELRREWREGWMVSGTYSYQKSRYLASKSLGDFVSLSQAPALREVPNSPNHLASIKGGVPILSHALMLMNRLTFQGPRFDRNDTNGTGNPPQGKTASAFLWDVVFSGSEAHWGLTYSFGFYNLFDTRWSVPVSAEFRQTTIVQSGRTVLASASVTF